jgi:PAS domain S-box-containing protein
LFFAIFLAFLRKEFIYRQTVVLLNTEEEMREKERRYSSLLENINLVAVGLDTNRNITYANPFLLKLTGYAQEEVLGKNWFDTFLPGKDKEVMKGVFKEILLDGFFSHYDNPILTKSGDERLIAWNNTILKDIYGQVLGTMSIGEDITERKRAEAERERLLAELEAKNKELESFTYTIAHDLKAPLVSLNGFSSVLQKEYDSQLGEKGKHYLDRIQANVVHMEALTTSLLELSRIGQVVGPIEEIEVAALLREVRVALAVRLKEAGAEFVVQEPLPTVRVDRGRIHQVFANLIDNAVKFRSAERAPRIEVGCRQESGFYRFHVADNGIGIAPQYHERVFAPFQKLHLEIEGVGIGLALVKKIVEHHGGRVWVESEAGKGSTFYFTISRG